MKRLTNASVRVDESTGKYLTPLVDLEGMKPRLLDLILNGPTLNGVQKDVLRQIIRQLYTRLAMYENAKEAGRLVVIPRWKDEEERLERLRLMRIMADGAIDRLMKNPLKEENGPDIAELRMVNTDRLLELAKADEEGRLFLLPLEPGRSMLCQEYFERPWVMKNVTLCVQYQSSTGIVFYMGYDVFRDLVERGRITPLSPEGEKTLEGKANV
jgi:hypothetical protein